LFPLKDNLPTERFPFVTVAFIALNVVVYFFLQDGGWALTANDTGNWPIDDYAAKPCELADECPSQGGVDDWVTVFTSMFMHGSLLHLGGNMLFLWIYGNNIEDSMGPLKFVGFYLVGGIAAIALQTAFDPGSPVPTVGASGAVSAVLGAYLLLYPRAGVLILSLIPFFWGVFVLPAAAVIGIWFVQQLVFGAADYASAGNEGGVAYFAHIGGFVFGLLTVKLLARRKRTTPAPYRV
jgi:membrane associated rhomboid family serine protease